MRVPSGTLLAGLLLLSGGASLRADEPADPVAGQKKAALAGWTSLDVGEPAQLETAHLLVFAPKSLEARLKDIGATLEKFHDAAAKNVQLEKEKMWSGKLTV